MKKYRYFAIDDGQNASDYYYTKKDFLKDLHTFGYGIVRLYSLKNESDVQELTSEDLVGVYEVKEEH